VRATEELDSGARGTNAHSRPMTIPSVDWWITSRCNLACDFCYGPEPGKDPRSLREGILDAIKASSADAVTLCGGEPLIVREIDQYAHHLATHQKRVVLNTNGLLLRRRFAVTAQPGGAMSPGGFPFDVVGLSIEGPTEKVHRAMRGEKADLTEVLAAAAFVSGLPGVSLKVATVVSAVNKADLEDLAEMVREKIKPDVWRLYQYSSRGPINHGQDRHQMDAEEFGILADKAAKVANPIEVIPSSEDANVGCLIVDARGDVLQPVSHGYQTLGNCLTQPVDKIWESASGFMTTVAQNKRWLSILPI
jgi:MoaA/NifB/PqqE/SkfB family radical SAM enzyme